jgi:HD domain
VTSPDPPITPPDTTLARAARDLVYASCEPHLVGHSERSFQFAALVAADEGVELDVEVLYIGTLMHDVGLAARFDGPDRFEMRGANAVRTMLVEAGMDRARAESVWDVIALHASTAIATHKSPETRIANRGISIDVRGAGADRLPPEAVRAVLDTWPRHQFPSDFTRTLVGEVRANPASVRSSWMESIAVAHVPDFEPADFLSTLHSSAAFA